MANNRKTATLDPVFDLTSYLIIFGVYFVAGAIKGTIGIGLPTVAISLLSQFYDPRLAIGLTLAPLFFSNVWQAWRAGFILRTLRRFLPYGATLAVVIYFSAKFAVGLSPQFLLMDMGGTVVLFAMVNLFFTPPELPDRLDTPGQICAGFLSGLMGGVTAIWGPPLLVFLIARRVKPEEFVRATGVLLTLGAIPLVFSYWQSGRFSEEIAVVSLMAVVPAVAGFLVGEVLRKRLNPERFQTAVLVVFLLLGLNLLQRGFFSM